MYKFTGWHVFMAICFTVLFATSLASTNFTAQFIGFVAWLFGVISLYGEADG